MKIAHDANLLLMPTDMQGRGVLGELAIEENGSFRLR
jgi:hypothetical protein